MPKVFIEESTLTAIGDAIRGKTGKTDLIDPALMSAEINSIEAGSGGGVEPPPEAFVLTGNCAYRFADDGLTWFFDAYKDKITTNKISNADCMFHSAKKITEIPFDINMYPNSSSNSTKEMFRNSALTKLPYFTGHISQCEYMFSGSDIRDIPEDWADKVYWTYLNSSTSYANNRIFADCGRLRRIPRNLASKLYTRGSGNSYVTYPYLFSGCVFLEEVDGLGLLSANQTANRFNSTFNYCYRLSKLTFDTNADGTPKTANWKSQTIDLNYYVGYGVAAQTTYYDRLHENTEITAATQVTDDATYQALKNDPNWWTLDVNYSRYNHDSAVETINSLPNTSAYGTNTIKFKKASGALTDGGAIENLTEEEIAVATAKGWTVTLV